MQELYQQFDETGEIPTVSTVSYTSGKMREFGVTHKISWKCNKHTDGANNTLDSSGVSWSFTAHLTGEGSILGAEWHRRHDRHRVSAAQISLTYDRIHRRSDSHYRLQGQASEYYETSRPSKWWVPWHVETKHLKTMTRQWQTSEYHDTSKWNKWALQYVIHHLTIPWLYAKGEQTTVSHHTLPFDVFLTSSSHLRAS